MALKEMRQVFQAVPAPGLARDMFGASHGRRSRLSSQSASFVEDGGGNDAKVDGEHDVVQVEQQTNERHGNEDVSLSEVALSETARSGAMLNSTALREWWVGMTMVSPHIVTLFDVVAKGGALGLVMEYCPTDLHHVMEVMNQPPPEIVIRIIVKDILQGLSDLHAQGRGATAT